MSQAFTNSGSTVAISTAAANEDLDATGFAALTFTEIANVGSLGERGANTNIVSYDTWGNDAVLKGKGMTNAGDPQLELAVDLTDAGQIAVRAAAGTKDNYAFKVTRPNGDVQYLRGLVTGPTEPGGRNEDFVVNVFTLALNQRPVDVPAP